MKALLTKISIRKTVGLYLGEHEVSVTKVASTPLGPQVIASSSEPYTAENMPEVVERLLVPLLGPKRRASVAVGIVGSRVFFGTRLTPKSGDLRPEAEIQKALCSSNISADDLVIDLLRGSVNKLPVARMAACKVKYMASVVSLLKDLGVRPLRTEPGPFALVRLAESQHRPPRRSKAILRIFLGGNQGLAVMVVGGVPTAWKTFVMNPCMESFAILSAARGLKTQQMHFGLEMPLDYALIHGRADLHKQLQEEQLPTEMETRVVWHEGPEFTGESISLGLAMGCLSQDIKAFDLSKTLKAKPPVKEIFPWGELGFTAALLGCMSVVMFSHAMKLDENNVRARAENSQHSVLINADLARLEKEKKSLENRVQAVRTFVETRMLWSTYGYDTSTRIPANAEINAFSGRNALACSAGGKGGKAVQGGGSFRLRGTAPLEKDGSIPKSIDAFLNAIPKDPQWKKDFSAIKTEFKLPPPAPNQQAMVDFTVIGACSKKASAKGTAKGAGKHKKK